MKPVPGTKTTVWLVEDHEDCRRLVARVINRTANLRCTHSFSCCEEALAALGREAPPGVVLLDVGLPRMNGIQEIFCGIPGASECPYGQCLGL